MRNACLADNAAAIINYNYYYYYFQNLSASKCRHNNYGQCTAHDPFNAYCNNATSSNNLVYGLNALYR